MTRNLFLFFLTFLPAIVFGQQQIDVQHYRYEIELTDDSDMINGTALITTKFLNSTSKVVFDLASIKESKGMQASAVFYNSEPLSFEHEENKLVIHLKKTAQKGKTGTFEIQYVGIPKDGLVISKNKYGDRTFFADNWPNRAHNWIPCIDIPADKASVEFIVTAPAHYKVISNGLLVSEKKWGAKKVTHWKEEMPIPTKVMVIGAADFAVARVDSFYHIPVTAWVYVQDSTKGFYDYALADDILKFFENYIAPYPYKKLANVQSKTIFGGMENASAIFYGEGTVTGTRSSEALIAHEIAHQWFGNTASEKTFSHLWLSEGFATYLTHVYMKEKHGVDSFYKRMEEDRKEIIDFVKTSNQPVVDSISGYMDLLNANSYQKGGWFLHMLRNEVGDKTFQKIIQTYYQQYKGSNADTRDFEAVVEKVSGEELTWFFDQWLYRPGIPELKMETKIQDNEFFLYVKQKDQLFRFDLEVTIIAEDGEVMNRTFEVSGKESEFKVPIKGSSVRFSIDPDVKLLYELKD